MSTFLALVSTCSELIARISLMSVFPSYIATGQVRALRFYLPAFDMNPSSKDPALLEEGALGDGSDHDSDCLKVGTGHLVLGQEVRQPGWEGSLVERVKGWLKRVFTLSR